MLKSWHCCLLKVTFNGHLTSVFFPLYYENTQWISLLWLTQQIMTNFIPLNDRNHRSRGQKSEVSITGTKSRCQRGFTSSRTSRGGSVHCSFRLLLAADIPLLVTTSLQSPWSHCLLLLSVSMSSALGLQGHVLWHSGHSRLMQDDLLFSES